MANIMAPNLRRIAAGSQAGRYVRTMDAMARYNQEIGNTPLVGSERNGVGLNGVTIKGKVFQSPAELALQRARRFVIKKNPLGSYPDDDNMIVDGSNDAQFIARNTQGLRRGGYGVPDLGSITNLSRPLYTNSAPQLSRNTGPHMGRYDQQYPVTNTLSKLMPWSHSRSQGTQGWQYPQTGPQDTRDI